MKNSNHSRDLSEKNISSLLWSYFLPAFVGVMANALYNIVGRIFIGQFVGTEALSGLTVVFPVMIIIMGFGMLFGIGSAILISIELGRGNREKAEFILGNGLFLMIISSLFLTIAGFFVKEKLLHSFGATESTIQYANDYLNIILAGTVFGLTGFALNTSIRAEGNARISMNSMLLSAGLNVV
ncbi:MAG TPA: MATE family efflux transporter, partial [Spirochaetota bacterium]|nr:MATE family efflux transporter [Spirochaetota bacterium]